MNSKRGPTKPLSAADGDATAAGVGLEESPTVQARVVGVLAPAAAPPRAEARLNRLLRPIVGPRPSPPTRLSGPPLSAPKDPSPAAPPPTSHPDTESIRQAFKGRFELVRQIGRGGMGVVFAARQIGTPRTFALKVFRGGGGSKDADRFQREMELTCRISHPNVVRIYEFGRTDSGFLFYSMELIEGVSLHELLTKNRQIPLDRILRIAHHTALGLAAAHEHGIIHRDVKPENIMVSSPVGWPDFARILDFGIARETRTWAPGQQPLTSRGVFLGTPRYASPEAIAADPLGPTADVYSLGCVLYQLLSGHGPFDHGNPITMMQRHLHETPTPIAQVSRVMLPPELAAFIDRMLRKKASERPESMEIIAGTLRTWLDLLANRNPARDDLDAPVVMRPRSPSLEAVLSAPAPAASPPRRGTGIPPEPAADRRLLDQAPVPDIARPGVHPAASKAAPSSPPATASPPSRALVWALVATVATLAVSLVLHFI